MIQKMNNIEINIYKDVLIYLNKMSINLIKSNKNYLPWVEKYRPKKLSDIILEPTIKTKINNFLVNKEISNMIITGHPGTGKTSTILCLAKQVYGEYFKDAVIEYNASDNRGLETINNSIIYFCKKKINLPVNLPKLVILDEADNITKKAQNTLCNLMELYIKNTKFVLTCNDYNKIIEDIQTRCLILRYNILPDNIIIERLKDICKKENVIYDDEGLNTILFICQGDIRLAVNYLESTYYGFNKITSENIYKICEKPPENIINNVMELSLKGELVDAFKIIINLKDKGYNNSDILLTMINIIKKNDLDENVKIELLDIVSDIYIVTNHSDTNLQILKCISQFYNLSKN